MARCVLRPFVELKLLITEGGQLRGSQSAKDPGHTSKVPVTSGLLRLLL